MSTQPAVRVTFELEVDTGGPVSAERFHRRATALMDELTKLEGEANPDVLDPTVSSDARRSCITVETLVLAEDPIDAMNAVLPMLRTALHAAGANTSRWPRLTRLDSSTEQTDLLAGV